MEGVELSEDDLVCLAELTIRPQVNAFATYCKQVKFFNNKFYSATFLPTIEEEPEIDHKSNTEST